MTTLDSLKAAFSTLASTHCDLKLLVLFGSRTRGEADPSSDWDFAFLLEPDRPVELKPFWFPGSNLLGTLCNLLHVSEDAIDLVDLSTCSEITAHFVARDGQVIYEKIAGEFAQFQGRALKTKAELKQYRHAQREKVLQTLERWGV
ncbi:nucleotidyltransferase domain-containing protein (plasmid) [Kovacikia minuta CCNUW1]|uniref:type VII toxin-antitoxin system MntA family adenylyltransferase antitoxin n=1 Tax=Kovacikia minuta TaxID=2931930 RepID=UPI001CD01280|nr:nucleotidyltransferase domain-containing protein [Kovacikia minuta]UBF30651.1 nucleotidyltransferase domain-containing protein [Kovacikia minuta CCNUW1]